MNEIVIGNKIFLVPDSDSSCELWKTYFTKLKKAVGKENAKTLWLVTWSKNGSVACTTKADFNHWLKKNDIDISTAATRALADISQIGGNILGLGKSLTKLLKVGIPIALGTVSVLVLIVLVNTAKNANLGQLASGVLRAN